MKEQLQELFASWVNIETRDIALLNELYSKVKGVTLDRCPRCRTKAINELRKYYELTFVNKPQPPAREYLLKPGNHQFAPGEKGIHNNENTSDAVLKWYLQHYPHIKPLFIKIPQ